MSVSARVGPGAARTDTFTLRKNLADTALTTSLTGAALSNADLTHAVTFNPGDVFSVKGVMAGSSTLQDVIILLGAY